MSNNFQSPALQASVHVINTSSFLVMQNNLRRQIHDSESLKRLEVLMKNPNAASALRGLIEVEIGELEKTRSNSLTERRIAYLEEMLGRIAEILESNDSQKDAVRTNAAEELANLSLKIKNTVDSGSPEWRMRAAIELIFAEDWKFESWKENAPFYVDGKKLKVHLLSRRNREMIRELEDPKKAAEELNFTYVRVRELISKSAWDVSKYVGAIFDIVRNPDMSGIYEKELGNQPWFSEFANRKIEPKSQEIPLRFPNPKSSSNSKTPSRSSGCMDR